MYAKCSSPACDEFCIYVPIRTFSGSQQLRKMADSASVERGYVLDIVLDDEVALSTTSWHHADALHSSFFPVIHLRKAAAIEVYAPGIWVSVRREVPTS